MPLFHSARIVALLLPLILSCPVLAQSPSGKEPGFTLCQTSGVCGKTQIYASSKGLKLVQKSTKCVLLMKAPDWKVHFFNTASKVIYETDAKNWKGNSSCFVVGLISAGRFSALKPRQTKATTATSIAGLHCHEIHLERIGVLPPDTPQNKIELKSAIYCGTTDLSVPPQAILVVQRFYRIPTLNGFPVKVDIFGLGGLRKTELNTSSRMNSDFDSATFAVPPAYKKVTTEEAVVVGSQQDLLDEMSDSLGNKTHLPK